MSIWLIVILGIIVISTILGYVSGLIKTVWSVASIILALVLGIVLNPLVTTVLTNDFHVDTYIEDIVQGKLDDTLDNITQSELDKQNDYITGLGLPSSWQKSLIQNNQEGIYESLGVNSFKDYISSSIVSLVINGMGYILTFIVLWIIMRILSVVINSISKLPIIHGANKITGGLLGLLRGFAVVWIVFLIASFCSGMGWAQELNQAIQDNVFLLFLYEHNLLTLIVI